MLRELCQKLEEWWIVDIVVNENTIYEAWNYISFEYY